MHLSHPLSRPRAASRAIVAALTLFVVSLSSSIPCSATTITATFDVTATVVAVCNLAPSPMAFGTYAGATVNSTATVTVTCTNSTPYQLGADNGLYSAYIGVYAKYMNGPSSNRLRYHLYTDAARTIEWGTTAGSNTIAGTGTGSAQNITVYGTIGAGSYGSVPGSYTDTVTLTVTF